MNYVNNVSGFGHWKGIVASGMMTIPYLICSSSACMAFRGQVQLVNNANNNVNAGNAGPSDLEKFVKCEKDCADNEEHINKAIIIANHRAREEKRQKEEEKRLKEEEKRLKEEALRREEEALHRLEEEKHKQEEALREIERLKELMNKK
jgi:hypothetical protein